MSPSFGGDVDKLLRGCDTCVCILKDSQYEAEGIWEGNGQLGQVEGEARAKVWPCGQEWHSCCHCRVGVLNCFEHG